MRMWTYTFTLSLSGQRVATGEMLLDARESCFLAGGVQLGTRGLVGSLVLNITPNPN